MVAHYRILEKIGAGGMGLVYKAEDTRLRRIVALKFLPAYALDNEEDRVRFTHEAQAAAALDHPNICTIHEINEAEGHHYIAMACIDGPSLKEKIREGALPTAEAVRIAMQAAAGLAHAHERGVIHRDIKPANILLTADGTVKICDFGLAKSGISQKITRTGSTLGTAAYMSPEQARSEPVDQRTDIWSLGAVLYEMLAGRPPFIAEHEAVVIYSILHEPLRPLTEIRADLPSGLPEIVERALAKDPARRYQTAREMHRDLETLYNAIAPKPISVPSGVTNRVAEPPVTETHVVRKRRRGRVVVIAGLAVAALAVLAFVLWPALMRRSEESASVSDSTAVAGEAATTAAPAPAPQADTIPTLAVLYFENLGGKAQEDFFAAGVTEDIIIGLSNLKRLRVLSRYDVQPYRGQPLSVGGMGKALKADYILEGSVRREKETLRMTAQLHRVADRSHLWAQSFDRPAKDVFKIQKEIADSVTAAMAVQLSAAEEQLIDRAPTADLKAYDYYLQGRQLLDRRSKEDNSQAEKMFDKAIALDKNYALALIGLAAAYLQRVDWWIDTDVRWLDEAAALLDRAGALDSTLVELYIERSTLYQLTGEYTAAIRAARRAVAIRPNDQNPHYLLAQALYYDVRWDEADREFRRAIELRPAAPEPYCWRAMIAGWSGRSREAERYLTKALELAPDAVHINIIAARFYFARSDSAKAASYIRKAIELRPKTPLFLGWSGVMELWNRRLDRAIDQIRDAAEESDNPEFYYFLGWAYRLDGKRGQAEKAFRNGIRIDQERLARDSTDPELAYRILLARCLTGEVTDPEPELKRLSGISRKTTDPTLRSYCSAAIWANLGNVNRALESLRKVLAANVYAPAYIAADPRFDAIKDDAGFRKLVGLK